jgi:hypothetical protein
MEMFVRFTTTLAWFLKAAAFIKRIQGVHKLQNQNLLPQKVKVRQLQKKILSQLQMGNA